MSVFQLGPILRNRREELGLSQEDLADGICAVPTLSRIENGERMPTKNHFEMLMQRLGYSAMSLDFFTDKQDFIIHELKIKLRYAYISKDFKSARKHLADFQNLLEMPTKIDEQFLILYNTLLFEEKYSEAEKLDRFEQALQLTCPKYRTSHLPPVLSYEEIILLNNIAICYDVAGDRKRTISILYTLKEYYDHHVVSTDEALRTQPMILYNLSKALGLSGRYDECIEICILGIKIARTNNRYGSYGGTLFNCAWAHLQRNQSGDKEYARQYLIQAHSFAISIANDNNTAFIEKYFKDAFGEEI